MASCSGLGLAAPSLCAGQPKGWHCQGDWALRCGYGDPYFVDCGFHGAVCKPHGDMASSGAWPCAIAANQSCNKDGAAYCEGTNAVFCSQGERWGTDCASRQLRCVESEGDAFCTRYTETCDPSAKQGCVDGKYTTCAMSGFGITYDCTTAGGQCKYTSCIPAGCKQIPFESKCSEACLGDSKMRVCVFWNTLGSGQPLTVDCKDYGFERCEMRDDPDSSRDFALCR